MFCLLIEIAITSGPCGLADCLPGASTFLPAWRRGFGPCCGTIGAGCETAGSESDQKRAASAGAAMPMTPAAVSTAIRHEFRKAAPPNDRSLAPNDCSRLAATGAPCPLTRIIFESQLDI